MEGLEWASWDRGELYGPQELHLEEDVMEKMLELLRSTDYLDETHTVTSDIAIVEKHLLAVGLFTRDLTDGQFNEGEEAADLPHWIRSPSYDFAPPQNPRLC